jgi:cytochrome c biogenesis protein CcdA
MNAPLALAFGAGMLASVNPCGFAMLPAYLSYFVGSDDGSARSQPAAAGRALRVGSALTAGFVATFGVIGLVLSQVSNSIQDHLPWLTIVVGLALIGLGLFLVRGRELKVSLPKLQRGGDSRAAGSMFLFGVSYATASLTCTIAPFLATTTSTFNQDGLLAGLATFVAYGLGMGAIVTLLTVAVAMARHSVVAQFRKAMPYVNRVAGALVVIAGLYVAYYGWYEVRLRRSDGVVTDPVVDRAIDIQNWLAGRIDAIGTGRVGVVALAVALLAVGGGLLRSRRRRADTLESETAQPDSDQASV